MDIVLEFKQFLIYSGGDERDTRAAKRAIANKGDTMAERVIFKNGYELPKLDGALKSVMPPTSDSQGRVNVTIGDKIYLFELDRKTALIELRETSYKHDKRYTSGAKIDTIQSLAKHPKAESEFGTDDENDLYWSVKFHVKDFEHVDEYILKECGIEHMSTLTVGVSTVFDPVTGNAKFVCPDDYTFQSQLDALYHELQRYYDLVGWDTKMQEMFAYGATCAFQTAGSSCGPMQDEYRAMLSNAKERGFKTIPYVDTQIASMNGVSV